MDAKISHVLKYGYLRFFYLHILLKNFAISLFDIFSGIFIYQLLLKNNYSSQNATCTTFIFIAATSFFQFLFIPLSLFVIRHFGLRRSILFGSCSFIFYVGILALSQFNLNLIWLASIIWGLYAALYWFAYHIYFVELTKDSLETAEVGVGLNLSVLASLFGPFIGGLIISFFGYPYLFLALIIVLFSSVLPLIVIPKSYNASVQFSILSLIKGSIFNNKRNLRGILGISILQSTFVNLWPLYILPLLVNVVFIGVLGTLINLVSIITNGAIGSIADRSQPKRLALFSTTVSFLAWVIASFVVSPIQIFFLSIFQSFGSSMRNLLFDANVYENSRHEGMYQLIAQREFAISLFSALFLTFCAGLIYFGVPFRYLFIISALLFLMAGSYKKTVES